jgi:hypothetical protein
MAMEPFHIVFGNFIDNLFSSLLGNNASLDTDKKVAISFGEGW